jgi:branched-chain amino acid transport system substrate-binding protein
MNQSRFFLTAILLWLSSLTVVYAEQGKFKIGVILPLSGQAADYGGSIENCIGLAKEDRPELFRNVEFIFEDAQHDPNKAVAAFRKLTAVDKVDLVYTWGVPFCKALAPIAEAARTPLIGQCIDQGSSAGRNYVLRFMNYTDEYLGVQTARLMERREKRIGLVLAEHPYLEEMHAALKRNLREGQTVEVIDSYQVTSTDFKSTVSKIRRNNYDSIGVFLYPGQIAQFYRQLREQRVSIPTFGTNFLESISELKLAGGTMEGAEFTNNTVKQEFADRYQAKYKNASQLGFGALAYEFTILMGNLFGGDSGAVNADKIMMRLADVSRQEGVAAGPYEFRNTKVAGKYFYFPISVKRISGEAFQIGAQIQTGTTREPGKPLR